MLGTLFGQEMIAGAGMGLFFVPLNASAFASITNAKLDEASGLMALKRNIGASIGIAVVSWLLVRQVQINWQNLISQLSPFNPALPRSRRQGGARRIAIVS